MHAIAACAISCIACIPCPMAATIASVRLPVTDAAMPNSKDPRGFTWLWMSGVSARKSSATMAYSAIVAVACFAGCIAVCEIDAAIGERSGLCWLRDDV